MKAFTDDDLNLLKEESVAEDYGGYQQVTISCDDLEALLARLEAAERVCKIPEVRDRFPIAIKAWKKACGE